jgi:hypothetical protein
MGQSTADEQQCTQLLPWLHGLPANPDRIRYAGMYYRNPGDEIIHRSLGACFLPLRQLARASLVRGRHMDACYFCARTALEWGSYVSLCQEWRSRTESQQLAVAQLAAIDAARATQYCIETFA